MLNSVAVKLSDAEGSGRAGERSSRKLELKRWINLALPESMSAMNNRIRNYNLAVCKWSNKPI